MEASQPETAVVVAFVAAAAAELLTNGQPIGLTSAQVADTKLTSELATLRASEAVCHADGNLDKRVDFDDVVGVGVNGSGASVFDFSRNGATGIEDLQWVLTNYGNDCRRSGPGKACQGWGRPSSSCR